MSRFLFPMWEGGGTVPPELAIVRRLLLRNHTVHVIGDPTIEDAARCAGATFTAWREAPHVTSLRPEDVLVRDWEIRNPFKLFSAMADALLCGPTRLFAREVLGAIVTFKPDVVAPDLMLIGAMVAAEKAAIPQAVLVPNLYPFPSKGRPMIGSGSMPARGVMGRLRDAAMAVMFRRMFDSGLKPVNEARASLGLPPLTHTFDQHARAERILVLSSEAFDFPGPPLPANVLYAGPQLDDPAWAETWNSPWGDQSLPLVLIAFSSTFQNQEDVLRRVGAAFTALPARGLMTTGPALDGRTIPVPGNVTVVRSAPHAAILPHAQVAVSHCGHGTTLKALAHGVPILCLPMGRDQGDNAARVVWHGAGLRLKPTASTAEIQRALKEMITNPGYRERAGTLATRMTAENTSDRAVAELERLASRGRN